MDGRRHHERSLHALRIHLGEHGLGRALGDARLEARDHAGERGVGVQRLIPGVGGRVLGEEVDLGVDDVHAICIDGAASRMHSACLDTVRA